MTVSVFSFYDIPFKWGSNDPAAGLDCFTLARYVHNQYDQGHPMKPLSYLYDQVNEHKHPSDTMFKLASELLGETHSEPKHLDLCVIKVSRRDSLATVIQYFDSIYVVFMGLQGARIQPLSRLSGLVQGFWSPDNILEVPEIANEYS